MNKSERGDFKYLCHSNNVRDDTLCLKTPIVASCATKPCLHLISYANTSCLTHNVINQLQVSRGQFNRSSNSLYSSKRENRVSLKFHLHGCQNNHIRCLLGTSIKVLLETSVKVKSPT